MSFETYRRWGLVSNLFLVFIPFVIGLISGFLLFSGLISGFLLLPGLISGSLLLSAPYLPDYLLIINFILNIAFLILFLMAMRGFSKYYNDTSIYQNSLYAVVVGIITIIISSILLLLYLINQFPSNVISIFSYVFVPFVGIVVGFFYGKAFHTLSEKSSEENFNYAGWLIFIGGILSAVIFIGFFIILLGRMIAVLAFFSIKPKLSQNSTQ